MNKNHSDIKIFTSKAHARINIIGGHTDYNQGCLLSVLTKEFVSVTLITNQKAISNQVIARSSAFGAVISYDLGKEDVGGNWGDYIKGVTKILRNENFNLSGFEVKIDSSIPMNLGFASGVALMVAFIRTLISAFKLDISDFTIAKLISIIKNEFLVMPVGVTDPLVISVNRDTDSVLFIDSNSLNFEQINFPNNLDILTITIGGTYSKRGEINICRRRECEEVVARLTMKSFCELHIEKLKEYESILNNRILFKRVKHVLTENNRVLQFKNAFLSGDYKLAGELMYLSHMSLKDDYEVSTAEIDQIIELAKKDANVFGARLATDSGLAGAIVLLIKKGEKEKVYKNLMGKNLKGN
ncbi:MAG: hypothetical protein HQK51_00035 [Oligoflexia bacterium]|nr:hypothetical protein [Oligoflexia bacterium]